MRVIRPESLTARSRRRPFLLAGSTIAAGLLALELAVIGVDSAAGTALLACAAAIGLGVGAAWMVRAIRGRVHRATDALVALLARTFGDDYTLVVAPRLPVRDASRLDGILVGPAGVRVLTIRDWEGRYRLRGRVWEFDARGRRGWIRCRTNPSFEATVLADGVARWIRETGLPDLGLRAAIVFPESRSKVVLEEPDDEVVTVDNAPWWANTIGRVRRVEAGVAARIVQAVLDASEPLDARRPAPLTEGPV